VLAFSAIRNNDKVGLILFSDEVENSFRPEGRKHVLRSFARSCSLSEAPRHRLKRASNFIARNIAPGIAVVVSDFIGSPAIASRRAAPRERARYARK